MPPFRSIIPWSIMPSGEPMPSISLETGGYRVGRRLRKGERSRRRLRKGGEKEQEEAQEGAEKEQDERQCQASLERREKALLHLCHSTVQHCTAECSLCRIHSQLHYLLLLDSVPVCKQSIVSPCHTTQTAALCLWS